MAKKIKGLKNAHASNSKYGMGDYYGSGIKNNTGRIIDGFGIDKLPAKKMKNPPKSLA